MLHPMRAKLARDLVLPPSRARKFFPLGPWMGTALRQTPWTPPDSSTTSYGESTEGVSGSRVGCRGSDFSMRKNWRQPMGWRVGFRGSGFPVWKNLCFFQRVGFPGSRFSIAKTRRVGFPVFMAAGRVSRVGFIPRKNEAGRVFGTLLL